jgi:ribokinase
VLGAAHLLLATERELALLLAGTPASGVPPAEAVMSRFGLGCVVVKRGGDGAELWTPSAVHRLPACPVDAVDPTGAGDALAGGFLGRLAQRARGAQLEAVGDPVLVEALGWGIVCASFAVEQPGYRGLMAVTWERLSRRMAQYRPTAEQEVP